MGWIGYLLGPTLRAPYGANKILANKCKSLALQNQTSQENDWLGDNWKAQISERSPGFKYLIGQFLKFPQNLFDLQTICPRVELFLQLGIQLYNGIFSEKYSQKYTVD